MNRSSKFSEGHSVHLLFFGLFALLAAGYLFDVLFQEKHLSAFDFILEKPAWSVEFGSTSVAKGVLADSPTAHYPYKKIFWESLRSGSNTEYLPHILTGQPTTGQGTGIFATSFFQLFMDVPNALDWSTWFRLSLAGILMYACLVLLGIRPAIAFLAGIAWAYNTHQLVWLLFPQHLATQLWIPLIFLLNIRILREGPTLSLLLGLGISVVLFYSSGYTQIVLYTFAFIGLFNVAYLASGADFVDTIKSWLGLHVAYLLIALLLLPDVLSQAEEISEGLRGAQTFRYKSFNGEVSFELLAGLISDLFPRPIEVVRLLSPHYLGGLVHTPELQAMYKTNEVEFRAFFGVVCMYLSLYGICGGLRRKDPVALPLLIVLLILFGLFNKNPLLVGLFNLVPLGGSGEFDRFITLIIFGFIVLSAYGLAFFLDDQQSRDYFSAGLPLILIVLWLLIAKLQYDHLVNLWVFMPAFAYLTGFIALGCLLSRRRLPRSVILVAVAITLYELMPAAYRFNTRLSSEKHFPVNSVIQHIQATPGNFRSAVVMDNTSYHHNVLTYYKLATVGGYATTVRNEYIGFLHGAYRDVAMTLNGVVFLMDHHPELLRLLNTRFIVTNQPLESDLVKQVFSNEANSIYEMIDPLDRVFCATRQVINPEMLGVPEQLSELVHHEDRPVIVQRELVAGKELTKKCLVSDLNVYMSQIDFAVTSDEPTLIFIPVNYHPNWSATLNEEVAVIHRGNFAFMVIQVPVGTSHITLSYTDTKLVIGAIGLILLGMLSLLYALTSSKPKWHKALLIVCGLLLVGKNSLSVPGIKNTTIPERAIEQSLDTSRATREG